jgi:hypothetical protein
MEVAYLVVQNKELDLVAIVDDEMQIRIFGYRVIGIDEISKYSPDYVLVTKEIDKSELKKIPGSIAVVDIRL